VGYRVTRPAACVRRLPGGPDHANHERRTGCWRAPLFSWSCGVEPRESAMIAVLVNTRELTELIALNVRPAADGAPPGPRAGTGRYRAAYE
jgi:hypothetical protein